MDENDPIYKAIDDGGGQTCDIPGVVKSLEAAGYMIVKVGPRQGQETDARYRCRGLAIAWSEAVRAEWRDYVATDPELTAQVAIAEELMRADGYTSDPVCMPVGQKPMIATVDGREAVAVDYCMGNVMPLSAIYTDRVRTVQSAAARVGKALLEAVLKAPMEWPITIASGETFNSLDDMERSPSFAVREVAQALRRRDRQ